MAQKPLIFCAIDTADMQTALRLVQSLGPVTGGLKLGLEFFNNFGPQGVEKIREACPSASLFLDLKFHDIPNTVASAVRAISANLAPAYLNIHAGGGPAMMEAARDVCAPATKLLAVTILTSLNNEILAKIGYEEDTGTCVQRLARLTKASGLSGVVCGGHEIDMLRMACGPDFILMVPGIRPDGSSKDDQKRVMTPKQAIQKGATHLVMGRPLTQAVDPVATAQAILRDIGT